jgi:hypothetical protein
VASNARLPKGISVFALAQAHSGYPYSQVVTLAFVTSSPGKNTNDGANYFNLDLKVSKRVAIRQVDATFFVFGQDALNSRNYAIVPTLTSSAGTGYFITTTGRKMELGVTLRF